jgi:hypothetical protein
MKGTSKIGQAFLCRQSVDLQTDRTMIAAGDV